VIQKNWQSSAAAYYDSGLKRLLDPKEIRLDATQVMSAILSYPTWGQWLPWIHGAGHSCIHLFLGFSMKTQSSPDEPLFFMHHCNVDRLSHVWADCYDYEKISGDALGPDQYVEINPTPGGTEVDVMISATEKQKVRVLLDTIVPYKLGGGSSIIIPPASWPQIKDLWTCGDQGKLGWMDMYYRYGPDNLAKALSLKNACKTGQTWTWVNYGDDGSKKRGETDPSQPEDNETKMYREIEETLLRKTEVEGLSVQTAIREMAMENCLLQPKPEMTPQTLSYLRMMGIAPSSLDRICDEPSKDPNFTSHQHSM